MRRVRFTVAVGGEAVRAGDDVDADAAAAQAVQRRRGGGEMGGAPVAGADGDEGLETRRARGQCRRDGECVGFGEIRVSWKTVRSLSKRCVAGSRSVTYCNIKKQLRTLCFRLMSVTVFATLRRKRGTTPAQKVLRTQLQIVIESNQIF
jgi:hypothetical protein